MDAEYEHKEEHRRLVKKRNQPKKSVNDSDWKSTQQMVVCSWGRALGITTNIFLQEPQDSIKTEIKMSGISDMGTTVMEKYIAQNNQCINEKKTPEKIGQEGV